FCRRWAQSPKTVVPQPTRKAWKKYPNGTVAQNSDWDQGAIILYLRQAVTEVFDEINSDSQSDLTLRFRDPLSKNLLKVA
ncbi:MAG TPA: hypothetical protein DIU00_21235, partial [Phycisphaerales bacterium]|nr:hypothetical protein [Phycisphaerales bacterium]